MQTPGKVTPLEHDLELWETHCRLLERNTLSDTLKRARERIAALEAENARLKDRRFRIQDGPSIPWRMIEPHAEQAEKNHGQTLERLHERGGLGCAEAVAVLESKPLRYVRELTEDAALQRLTELMRAFEGP